MKISKLQKFNHTFLLLEFYLETTNTLEGFIKMKKRYLLICMLSTLVLTACGEGFQNSEGGYTIEVLPAQTEEGGYIIELLPAQTEEDGVPTEDPVTEDPVTEDPVTEDPVVEDPVVEDPVVELMNCLMIIQVLRCLLP